MKVKPSDFETLLLIFVNQTFVSTVMDPHVQNCLMNTRMDKSNDTLQSPHQKINQDIVDNSNQINEQKDVTLFLNSNIFHSYLQLHFFFVFIYYSDFRMNVMI